MVSFLFFNGSKTKDGRSPATPGILFDAPTATFHQDNAYTDFPLHGLWKIADDRVMSSNFFLSAKYAYYNTGNALTPDGRNGHAGGPQPDDGPVVRVVPARASASVRSRRRAPSAHSFVKALGVTHDLEFGTGFRTTDSTMLTEWPGNGILAIENSPTDFRAQVFRQGNGANRANYYDFHIGDTIAKGRATINVGLRYDRQWGSALQSEIAGQQSVSDARAGTDLCRLRLAVYLEHLLAARGPDLRARREPPHDRQGGLQPLRRASSARRRSAASTPPSTAGSATYRWVDTNQRPFRAGRRSADRISASRRAAASTRPTRRR